jgi:hypothetical protein
MYNYKDRRVRRSYSTISRTAKLGNYHAIEVTIISLIIDDKVNVESVSPRAARAARTRGAISVRRIFVQRTVAFIMKHARCSSHPRGNLLCACVWLNVLSKGAMAMRVSTCAVLFFDHARVRSGNARPFGRIRQGGAPARMGCVFGSANGSTSGSRRTAMRPKQGHSTQSTQRRWPHL